MKDDSLTVKRVYAILYAALFIAVTAFVVLKTLPFDSGYNGRLTDFCEGWADNTGQVWDIEDITYEDVPVGGITITKQLPWDLTEDDAICFETKNLNVSVHVDDREIYRFTSRENITGMGYGFAYHQVNLDERDAKKPISITYSFVIPQKRGGKLQHVYLCHASDYIRMIIGEKAVMIVFSLLIVFFGLLILMIYLLMPNRKVIPYDFMSLGITAFMAGTWALIDTNIPQLLTGYIYIWRTLSRLLILLVGYPYICFFISLTRQKKNIYSRIMFWINFVLVVFILLLRYFAGVDMIYSFSRAVAALGISVVVMIIIVAADNSQYCRLHGIKPRLINFFLGFTVLWGSAMLDVILYMRGVFISDYYGTFFRAGMMAFVVIMMFQFFVWWTRDQASAGRDRFVNRALQYALSNDNDPEYGIRSMLEYIGTELKGERCFVFEIRPGGSLHGIYEWVEEGLPPMATEIDLPYKGLVGNYEEVLKTDHRFVIDDPESFREKDAAMYELLQKYQINRMVLAPLEGNGKLMGLLGLDEMPRENIEESAEIVRIMAYFMTQLILQRDAQDKLSYFSYNDALTGVKNRHAYREFVDKRMDLSSSFGFLMCDINGLKTVNDSLGHEAGDKLILNTAKCLTEVFGTANVYRMGGDEFVALGFESDETFFRNDVERAKRLMKEKSISVSMGAVYNTNGTSNLSKVESHADMLMYREKEAYYKGANDRRR